MYMDQAANTPLKLLKVLQTSSTSSKYNVCKEHPVELFFECPVGFYNSILYYIVVYCDVCWHFSHITSTKHVSLWADAQKLTCLFDYSRNEEVISANHNFWFHLNWVNGRNTRYKLVNPTGALLRKIWAKVFVSVFV